MREHDAASDALLKLFRETPADQPIHLTPEQQQTLRLETVRQENFAKRFYLNRRQRRARGYRHG